LSVNLNWRWGRGRGGEGAAGGRERQGTGGWERGEGGRQFAPRALGDAGQGKLGGHSVGRGALMNGCLRDWNAGGYAGIATSVVSYAPVAGGAAVRLRRAAAALTPLIIFLVLILLRLAEPPVVHPGEARKDGHPILLSSEGRFPLVWFSRAPRPAAAAARWSPPGRPPPPPAPRMARASRCGQGPGCRRRPAHHGARATECGYHVAIPEHYCRDSSPVF